MKRKRKRIYWRNWVKLLAAIMAAIGFIGIYYCPLTSTTNIESRIKGLFCMALILPLVIVTNKKYIN